MSFPGMTPPMGGMGGIPGNQTQGMNEQEQAMVKMVRFYINNLTCHTNISRKRCKPEWNPVR